MIEMYLKNGGERFNVIDMSPDFNDDTIIRVVTTSTNRVFHLLGVGKIEEKLKNGVVLITDPHMVLYIVSRMKTYIDLTTVNLQLNKHMVSKLFPDIQI